jgi:hypothetical protein
VTANDGAVMGFPDRFNINVRVVGPDSSRPESLRVNTTAYVPACDGIATPEPYRTKYIVFPSRVISGPASKPIEQNWPLSSQTLTNLGVCHDASRPWYQSSVPSTGTVLLEARVQNADGTWSQSTLMIRVGGDYRAERLGDGTKSAM